MCACKILEDKTRNFPGGFIPVAVSCTIQLKPVKPVSFWLRVSSPPASVCHICACATTENSLPFGRRLQNKVRWAGGRTTNLSGLKKSCKWCNPIWKLVSSVLHCFGNFCQNIGDPSKIRAGRNESMSWTGPKLCWGLLQASCGTFAARSHNFGQTFDSWLVG